MMVGKGQVKDREGLRVSIRASFVHSFKLFP